MFAPSGGEAPEAGAPKVEEADAEQEKEEATKVRKRRGVQLVNNWKVQQLGSIWKAHGQREDPKTGCGPKYNTKNGVLVQNCVL